MSQFALLRTRRFAPLFVTQFLGAFNDNVYKNALIIFVTFRAAGAEGRGGALLVTAAAGIFILPFFLFSASAGQLADRCEKSRLIERVKIAEIVIMSLGAVAFVAASVPMLMAVLFLMGAQSAVFGPLKYAILPQHLPLAEITGGNGLIQAATYVAILTGMILGGGLAAVPGHGDVLAAATVVGIALAGWLASRHIPEALPPAPDLEVSWNVWSQTIRGLRDAAEGRVVLASIIGISWFWFVGATFLQLLPTYARDALGGGPDVVILLLAVFSVGIGLGALACERFSSGHIEPALVPVGAAGMSLFALAPLAFPPPPAAAGAALDIARVVAVPGNWPVLGGFALLALAGGLYIVPLFVLLQTRSEVSRRARVIAANNIVNAGFMVVSALMTMALLAASFSYAAIFAVVAVLNAAVAAGVFLAVPEFTDAFRRRLGRA